jgi:GNAT superfamily N-acetyltransferase
MMDVLTQQALAFLRRDVLRNIVPLKMPAAYPDAVQVHYHEDDAEAGSRFTPSDVVVVSERVDERCFDLYAAQGYTRDEVRRFFSAGGALSFALYRGEAPVAACFAYQNFERVYKIGGVYTLPDQRRMGHARKLIETTLHTLARRGDLPRYQVHELNQPSIRLAEAIGLEPFVTIEHWLAEKQPSL